MKTRWVRFLVAAVAVCCALVPGAGASTLPSNCTSANDSVTCTFALTHAAQDFTVPAGVSSITVDADGAQGASANGGAVRGLGAHVHATLPVTPGTTLQVLVGGAAPGGGDDAGGFNGGGASSRSSFLSEDSGGGGGATDLRTSPYGLADRILVAGGGGGAGGSGAGGGGPDNIGCDGGASDTGG